MRTNPPPPTGTVFIYCVKLDNTTSEKPSDMQTVKPTGSRSFTVTHTKTGLMVPVTLSANAKYTIEANKTLNSQEINISPLA